NKQYFKAKETVKLQEDVISRLEEILANKLKGGNSKSITNNSKGAEYSIPTQKPKNIIDSIFTVAVQTDSSTSTQIDREETNEKNVNELLAKIKKLEKESNSLKEQLAAEEKARTFPEASDHAAK